MNKNINPNQVYLNHIYDKKDILFLKEIGADKETIQQAYEILPKNNIRRQEATKKLLSIDCKNISLQELNTLISQGADINVQNQNGLTPFMEFARYNRVDCMELSYAAGIDLNEKDKKGKSAFIHTLRYCSLEAMNFLIEKKANINTQGRNGETVLMWAARTIHVHCIKLFINAGADVNIQDKFGRTALMYLIQKWPKKGSKKALDLLMSNGADITLKDKNGKRAIDYAKKINSPELIKKIETIATQKLFKKIWNSHHFEEIKNLIASGADINSQLENGRTLLMVQAYSGNEENIKWLIQNGADTMIQSREKKTAYDYAHEEGFIKITEILKKIKKQKLSPLTEAKSKAHQKKDLSMSPLKEKAAAYVQPLPKAKRSFDIFIKISQEIKNRIRND